VKAPHEPRGFAIWGSELSPFALKLRALFDYAELPYTWLPQDGGRLQNLHAARRIERAKRTRSVVRYPERSPLDEYPLVPYLLERGPEGHTVHYDSSALAHWLDDRHPAPPGPLTPEDPALAFAAQLIDEAFDEFVLYLVHHKRWVLSATSNDAGRRLAREFRRLIPPGVGPSFGRRFARRQVRRLPYLFSVAPPGLSRPDLPRSLTPPSRAGFPGTHDLLDDAWESYLAGMESVLTRQPYLLGQRFTVADASAYGQLGMNLKDPAAADAMRERAPTTHAWLCQIRDGGHVGSSGRLALCDAVGPLLAIMLATFVPLMRQNARAYDWARERGESLFNEKAFDRGRSLYDGELLGRPFRSGVKTFQVRVWREIRAAWDALPRESREQIEPLLPPGSSLD
jgi:glutathione S-transferase